MNEKTEDAFKTISEVSGELNIPQHVLRFWEKKFKHIKPMTRGGGRRLYRPEDVELLKAIHNLLYTEMYTISGVQKIFKDKGKNFILDSVGTRENKNTVDQTNQGKSEIHNHTADLFSSQNPERLGSEFKIFLNDSISELESLKEILQRSYH